MSMPDELYCLSTTFKILGEVKDAPWKDLYCPNGYSHYSNKDLRIYSYKDLYDTTNFLYAVRAKGLRREIGWRLSDNYPFHYAWSTSINDYDKVKPYVQPISMKSIEYFRK